MNSFRNMKIGKKLGTGFGIVGSAAARNDSICHMGNSFDRSAQE